MRHRSRSKPLSNVVLVCTNSKHWMPHLQQEYMNDLNFPKPRRFSLRPWVDRGLIFLDSTLLPDLDRGPSKPLRAYQTVRRLSHKGGYVFILYGTYDRDYRGAVDEDTNLVITRGNRPFSTAAEYLGLDRQLMWRL